MAVSEHSSNAASLSYHLTPPGQPDLLISVFNAVDALTPKEVNEQLIVLLQFFFEIFNTDSMFSNHCVRLGKSDDLNKIKESVLAELANHKY